MGHFKMGLTPGCAIAVYEYIHICYYFNVLYSHLLLCCRHHSACVCGCVDMDMASSTKFIHTLYVSAYVLTNSTNFIQFFGMNIIL